MTGDDIHTLGDELYAALRGRTTVPPLTERSRDITIDDAYQVSLHMVERRLADGERIVGKKTGVTGLPVQQMLNVHQPDFGYLTDRMQYANGAVMPISSELIQPRAEGEIAFVLARDLRGPGVTAADVIAATDFVSPCFEVVDSRIDDWRIAIEDTVADNASSGLFLLGDDKARPSDIDFFSVGMVVEKSGAVLSTGAGAAAMGSPVNCVAWLANTLGDKGVALEAGEVILSGSLVPLEPIIAGDVMTVTIAGIGTATVEFA